MKREPFCIDVREMTIEQKKRVQDLLFEFGYSWRFDGKTHQFLDRDRYTNIVENNETDEFILFGNGEPNEYRKSFLVTLEELESRLLGRGQFQKIDLKSEDFSSLLSSFRSGELYYRKEHYFCVLENKNTKGVPMLFIEIIIQDNVYRKRESE